MNQIIIPSDIDFCIEELFNGKIVKSFHEIFESNFAPFGYDATMQNLEKWQDVGIWSMSPIIIETEFTQSECIHKFSEALNDYNWHDIIVTLLSHKYHTTKASVEQAFSEGKDGDFAKSFAKVKKFVESL